MSDKTAYGHIFKTTFVFGFVQVFKAVVSIVKNKLVAISINTEPTKKEYTEGDLLDPKG